ncbi:MAG: SRPBCC family protein [Acidobacteriota bacterium]
MTRVVVTRRIRAPRELVFRTIADPEEHARANPDIVRVDYLSERRWGAGTRFREVRRVSGGEEAHVLVVLELDEGRSVRMATDSHGTLWDSTMAVRRDGERTELTVTMDAKAHKLVPKLLNPLLNGLFASAISKDLDRVAAYCEARARDEHGQDDEEFDD